MPIAINRLIGRAASLNGRADCLTFLGRERRVQIAPCVDWASYGIARALVLGGSVSCQGCVEGERVGREWTNMFRAVVVPARKAVVRNRRVLWRCIASVESGMGFFLKCCRWYSENGKYCVLREEAAF